MMQIIKRLIKPLVFPALRKLLKIYNWTLFQLWKEANGVEFLPIETDEGVKFPRAEVSLEAGSALYTEDSPKIFLNVDSIIFPHVLVNKQWDFENIETFLDRISSPAVGLIDIGANVGLFTRQSMIACPKISHAYCFEPNKGNFDLLTRNLETFPETSLYNLGISERNETAQLFVDMENSGNLSMHKEAMLDHQYAVENIEFISPNSPNAPFSSISRMHGSVVYKSDTQGADELILTCFDLEFWDNVECAMIEVYGISGKRVDYDCLKEIVRQKFSRIYSYRHSSYIDFDEYWKLSQAEDNECDDIILLK